MRTLSINKGKDNIMARIVGVDIPRNKKIAFSLCYIHGIGMSTALEICKTAKIVEIFIIKLKNPLKTEIALLIMPKLNHLSV